MTCRKRSGGGGGLQMGPLTDQRGKCLAEGLTIYTLPMTRLNKECQSGAKEREREKWGGQETKG